MNDREILATPSPERRYRVLIVGAGVAKALWQSSNVGDMQHKPAFTVQGLGSRV